MLSRIERGSSSLLVSKLLRTLLPDATTVLDCTYNKGAFWLDKPEGLRVLGSDIDRRHPIHVQASFEALPFATGSVDVVVFDPPYLTDTGRASIIADRFSSYGSIGELFSSVVLGTKEAWRVARLGIIVKVQDYMHASRLVRMGKWVEDTVDQPLYDWCLLESPGKIEDSGWSVHGPPLSVRSNATTWLVFRKDGSVHKRRVWHAHKQPEPTPEYLARIARMKQHADRGRTATGVLD